MNFGNIQTQLNHCKFWLLWYLLCYNTACIQGRTSTVRHFSCSVKLSYRYMINAFKQQPEQPPPFPYSPSNLPLCTIWRCMHLFFCPLMLPMNDDCPCHPVREMFCVSRFTIATPSMTTASTGLLHASLRTQLLLQWSYTIISPQNLCVCGFGYPHEDFL